MLDHLLFTWHFRNNRFAQAMATIEETTGPGTSKQLWALYRLGMHTTVVAKGRADDHWRGAFASAISSAACGHQREAEIAARDVMARRNCRHRLLRLAIAMAPFMPELSLEMVELSQKSSTVPASLHVALLLRTGQEKRARRVLKRAFDQEEERQQPELYLHQSNANPGSPGQQLDRLNAFFSSHDLPPVTLVDESRPPSPKNLQPKEPIRAVDGPLVTVLMTAFQTADRVGAAIESVLGQSYRNIELIVVDDGSTDGTSEIVGAWVRRDHRVRAIRLDHNGGAYCARNTGLALCRGEFLTCHDSDDFSHPLKIEQQVLPLLENGLLVCTTSHWVRMRDDGVTHARPVHPLMRLNPSSPLFRRGLVLSKAGVWDSVRTGADMEFLARLKLVFGAERVRRVVKPLSLGSHRPDSLMNEEATGYGPMGISPLRLAYWERWSRWHLGELRRGRMPRIFLGGC